MILYPDYYVMCDRCGHEETMQVRAVYPTREAVERAIRKAGWYVSPKGRIQWCDECAARWKRGKSR